MEENKKIKYEYDYRINNMLLNIAYTKLAFDGEKRFLKDRDLTLLN